MGIWGSRGGKMRHHWEVQHQRDALIGETVTEHHVWAAALGYCGWRAVDTYLGCSFGEAYF